MDEEIKNKIKGIFKSLLKRPIKIIIIILLIIILIIPGSAYKIKLDDGTYEEDDWSNTQYGAEQYMQNTSIGSDGKITTNMTAQELWDKLIKEHGRVDLYLDGPEQLLKLMNAQMITQYLDNRENPDEEIDWDAIADVNSNEIQGIIKLKRAQSDGVTKTMTYVDPETFQSYIDAYNSSGSESDRNQALSHFTLERKTIANNAGTAKPIEAGETINIPEGLGASHTYMGWQLITDSSSTQYQLRETAGMNFDEEGFGRINGRYVIACTTTFGNVGDYVDFYQADGSIIQCIIGDIKNQSDEGCNEWGHDSGQTIVEFVVDTSTWYSPDHVNPGTPNCHPEWNQYLTKAVNGGSYFDNPNFGNNDIKPNEKTDEKSNDKKDKSELYWPTDETNITSEFGLRSSPTEGASSDHRGIDISVATGTNVYACEDGTVTTAGDSDSAGNWIEIDHGNGYVTKYMHNSELLVASGEYVKKGQIIAKSGSTGISTGPHLHFQIEYNGEAVDPLSFKYNNDMGNGTGGIGGSSSSSNSNSTMTTYTAKVATWNERTDTVESNDPDVQSYSTTTYSMSTTNINYQDFVSGYTMPFDYLWDLLVISEDQDFVLDLADLVYNSQIEITVHDNLSVNTNVNTYTYTENERIVSGDVRIVGVSPSRGGRVGTGFSQGTAEKMNAVDRSVVHTTITKSNTLDISLTKANVWIVNYTKEYAYQKPENIVTEGGAGTLEDIASNTPDRTTQTDDIGYGEAQRQAYHNQWITQFPDIITGVESVRCDYYYSTTNRNESITNTLEKNTYIASPPDVQEKTDKNATEDNFVTILMKGSNRQAKRLLLETSSWLFELLIRNDSTADMIDLTKYLFYKATNDETYWDPDDEFNFDIFKPENFVNNSSGNNGNSGIDGVPGQIYDYLLRKGVSPVGAAAIVGNIERECSFNSASVNSTGHSGLCQWDSGRTNALKDLANQRGKDWTDVEIQLDYMWQELSGSYSSVKDVIMSATQESDLEYATWYFARNYEVCFIGTWPDSKNDTEPAKRYEYAQKWYKEYQQGNPQLTGEGTVYYQDDYADVAYGGGTIATSGCGPTSFSMIASDYLGTQVTPVDAIAWCGNTYYVSGVGTSWAYFAAAASHFNLPCTVVDLGNDINAVVDQLRNGNLVISSQGPGIFTGGGHFILLSSVDDNGGIKVRDPNKNNAINKGYKDRTFSASEISASGINYWAFVRN